MNEHLDFWIDAYLDGELPARMFPRIEAHLKDCEACRELLRERETLSSLLQSVPEASLSKSEAQFLFEVETGIETVQRKESYISHGIRDWLENEQVRFVGWSSVSLLLLLAISFFQTVGVLSEMLSVAPIKYKAVMDQLILMTAGTQPSAFTPVQAVLGGAGLYGLLDLSGWMNLVILLVLGFLNIVWLVIWLLRHRSTGRKEINSFVMPAVE